MASLKGRDSRDGSQAAHLALLQSMVIQAWTAFEVLAVDLWSKVIAKRPALDPRSVWTNDEKKWSGFRSRSKIANIYRYTFRKNNSEIIKVLDNPAVHALAIIRNVVVHSGGRIDKDFIRDRKGLMIPRHTALTTIPQLKSVRGRKIGYAIPFSGDFVRNLVYPVTPLAFELVKAVDEWLYLHP